MNYLRISMISLLLIMLSYAVKADKSPIKFGKISLEELQMTNYAPDSTAPAVVIKPTMVGFNTKGSLGSLLYFSILVWTRNSLPLVP